MSSLKSFENPVIYTCVFGGYSKPTPPDPELLSRFDFVEISDKRSRRTSWPEQMIVNEVPVGLSLRRAAKKPKLFPWNYFSTDISVWIDGNITLLPQNFIKLFDDFRESRCSIGLALHNKRDSLYSEFQENIRNLKDDPTVLKAQLEKYRDMAFWSSCNLYQGRVILRRHDCNKVRRAMEMWMGEIDEHSVRDQLSLPLAITSIPIDEVFVISSQKLDHAIEVNSHQYFISDFQPPQLRLRVKLYLVRVRYKFAHTLLWRALKLVIRRRITP